MCEHVEVELSSRSTGYREGGQTSGMNEGTKERTSAGPNSTEWKAGG